MWIWDEPEERGNQVDPTLHTVKGLAPTEGRTGLKERWKAEAATLDMELCFATELLAEGADMRTAFWVTVARKEREGVTEEEEAIQVADLANYMRDIGQEGMNEVLQNYAKLCKPITTLPLPSREPFKIVLKERPTPNHRVWRSSIC